MDNFAALSRMFKVLGLFAGILWDFQREKIAMRIFGRGKVLAKRPAMFQRQAATFRRTALEMGGLLVKLGQFLSSRVDLLPAEYITELAILQDEVPPAPFSAISRMVEVELGSPFREFAPSPLASASLGQVHLAQLPDGQTVAVKVQRPNMERIIETDLQAVKIVVHFLQTYSRWAKAFDLETVHQEFARTVREELDYINEGKNAERFAANFTDRPWIIVPRIYWNLTSKRVLTMEYVTGYKVTDQKGLDGADLSRRKISTRIVRAYLDQLLRHGFVHLDPHPGNLLVREDGAVIFLDFGMMLEIPPELRSGIRALFLSVAEKDSHQMVAAFQELGFLRPEANVAALRRLMAWLLDQFYGKALSDIRELNFHSVNEAILRVIRSAPFQIPAKITFLGRAVSIVVGLCTGLDPELNVVQIFRPYASKFISTEPDGLLGVLPRRAVSLAKTALELPGLANRFFQGLERGDLDIPVDFTAVQDSLRRIESLLGKLVWLVSIGLLLGIGAILHLI